MKRLLYANMLALSIALMLSVSSRAYNCVIESIDRWPFGRIMEVLNSQSEYQTEDVLEIITISGGRHKGESWFTKEEKAMLLDRLYAISLTDKSGKIRAMAIHSIRSLSRSRYNPPEAVPDLNKRFVETAQKWVRDVDDVVRAAAITALGRLKDEPAGKLISDGVFDKSPVVRLAAVAALSRYSDANAISLIEMCLYDSDEKVRKAAKTIIDKIKTAK